MIDSYKRQSLEKIISDKTVDDNKAVTEQPKNAEKDRINEWIKESRTLRELISKLQNVKLNAAEIRKRLQIEVI